MDTPSHGSDDGDEEDDEDLGAAARHYSTGKLTAAQARTVNSWRRELHRPRRRIYPLDGRPAASSSDCVAAAVLDFLGTDPPALDVARYAAQARLDQKNRRPRRFPGAQHVSFYLPATAAARAEDLIGLAHDAHRAVVEEMRDQARRRFAGAA